MASLRPARFAPAVALALLAGPIGCGGGEGVSSYTVPRTSEKADPAGDAGYRILGAAFPAADPVWYFKLTGKAADLAAVEADFDKLLATVKLPPNDGVPQFTLPAGWDRGGPRSVSSMGIEVKFDETLKVAGLEVTISKAGGGAVQNVDRWAKQVGLPGVRLSNLGDYTREFAADGVKGLRVDVKGQKNPAARPMAGGR